MKKIGYNFSTVQSVHISFIISTKSINFKYTWKLEKIFIIVNISWLYSLFYLPNNINNIIILTAIIHRSIKHLYLGYPLSRNLPISKLGPDNLDISVGCFYLLCRWVTSLKPYKIEKKESTVHIISKKWSKLLLCI